MKRAHIFGVIGLLTLLAVLLGTSRSNLPVVQYLGNTTGVLLGFVLGVWWQETEKERARKEREAEKERAHKEAIEQFWKEYKPFLLDLERKVNALKYQITNPRNIYDTIIEYRLPLPEATYFQKQAAEIDLDRESRQEIAQLANQIRMLDEYMDFGAEKLKQWHGNYRSIVESLFELVRKLNVKYSGRTAV